MSRVQRAQISIEYLLILAFVFAILIPGIYFFYSYSQTSTAGVASAQFNKMGQEMLATSQKTIAQGTGSWLTLKLNIPENMVDINVSCEDADTCKEIVISYTTDAGISSAIFFSDLNLAVNESTPGPLQTHDGSVFSIEPHSGRTNLRFAADRDKDGGNVVVITETY